MTRVVRNSGTIVEMFDDLQQTVRLPGSDRRSRRRHRGRPRPAGRAVLDAAVLRHRGARRRGARRVRAAAATIPYLVTRCRWPSSARACSKSCRRTSARASGRSCRSVWPYVDYYGLRDVFVIRYAPGRAGVAPDPPRRRPGLGFDQAQRRLLTAQRWCSRGRASTTRGLGVGEMLVWPSLVTHPHETTPLAVGVKYALTVWFELPSF